MNTEEIPKKCTVNSFFFFFFSSLLPFCYFSLFPVHVFGWIRHLWPAVPMSPVQSCDLPPWHSSTVQVKALSKSFWGPQAEHGRLCFFPGVLTSPSCWKYCSSLLISYLPYFQRRQIKQSPAQRAYGWEQGQNVEKSRIVLFYNSTLLGGLKQSQVHTKVAKHSKVALQQSLTWRQLAVIWTPHSPSATVAPCSVAEGSLHSTSTGPLQPDAVSQQTQNLQGWSQCQNNYGNEILSEAGKAVFGDTVMWNAIASLMSEPIYSMLSDFMSIKTLASVTEKLWCN